MLLNRVLGIAGVMILFGGGLVALLYSADVTSSSSLHLAFSVLAGMVAMSGIIVINSLLSLSNSPAPHAGGHVEATEYDKVDEAELEQVADSFTELRSQTLQPGQTVRQQEHHGTQS